MNKYEIGKTLLEYLKQERAELMETPRGIDTCPTTGRTHIRFTCPDQEGEYELSYKLEYIPPFKGNHPWTTK